MKLYSYVVDHDNGHAPNPYFDFCTLCRCKFRESAAGRRKIVELAEKGDWVVGTGGANPRKSAGHGNLVYAMKVDEKPSRLEYFKDSRFKNKKPVKRGTYEQTRGDNIRPLTGFEKHQQFALISQHFYYFGAEAKKIPQEFDLEKKSRGFRCISDQIAIRRFVGWLRKEFEPGKHAEPCYQERADKTKGNKRCKSSY